MIWLYILYNGHLLSMAVSIVNQEKLCFLNTALDK